jgi:hypothetical protein
MNVETFFNKLTSVKEEMNSFINGEKGPLKDINITIAKLTKELDENTTIYNMKNDSYNLITNPTTQEDMMNALLIGPEYALLNRFMNPTKEMSEEDKKRATELQKEITSYENIIVSIKKSLADCETKKKTIVEEYNKFQKLYYYMYIFDVDIKNADSIENLNRIISTYDSDIIKLIDSKIKDNNAEILDKIDKLTDRVRNINTSHEIIDRIHEIETKLAESNSHDVEKGEVINETNNDTK